MSASSDVKADDGSGDWFKVRDALFCSSPQNDGALKNAWCTWGQPGIEFTVPDTIRLRRAEPADVPVVHELYHQWALEQNGPIVIM